MSGEKGVSQERAHALKPKITIQNVVASARLKHGVDLNAIIKAFPHVQYRPQVFPGLVFRLKKPKSCFLIFNSGNMVCTGAKSEREARRAVLKVVRELRKAGIRITGRPEFAVQNIVAVVDFGEVVIDLEEALYAAYRLEKRVMYEPGQFPGVIYHMEDPKVVFLIFASGKFVCVGAKREGDVYRAVKNLVTLLDGAGVLTRKEIPQGHPGDHEMVPSSSLERR